MRHRGRVGKHFMFSEVACHHCGNYPAYMESVRFRTFVDLLDDLRDAFDHPIIINSWYRCGQHPIEKAKPEPGIHSYGLAVDMSLDGVESLAAIRTLTHLSHDKQIPQLARKMGFGISQRKDHPRYLHFDIAGVLHRWSDIRPNVWSY